MPDYRFDVAVLTNTARGVPLWLRAWRVTHTLQQVAAVFWITICFGAWRSRRAKRYGKRSRYVVVIPHVLAIRANIILSLVCYAPPTCRLVGG